MCFVQKCCESSEKQKKNKKNKIVKSFLNKAAPLSTVLQSISLPQWRSKYLLLNNFLEFSECALIKNEIFKTPYLSTSLTNIINTIVNM